MQNVRTKVQGARTFSVTLGPLLSSATTTPATRATTKTDKNSFIVLNIHGASVYSSSDVANGYFTTEFSVSVSDVRKLCCIANRCFPSFFMFLSKYRCLSVTIR